MNEPTILQAIYDEQKHQGAQIDRLHEKHDATGLRVADLTKEVAKLKVKSSLWGSLSGAVAAGVAMAGQALFGKGN